jgi:T-complex protein 1 subunit gamma
MKALGIWEPYAVKVQTLKTAIEAATMLLRIDDIVSGMTKKAASGPAKQQAPTTEDHDNVDSERMLAE